MTRLSNYASFRTINQTLSNAGFVCLSHDACSVNGRREGCISFWKNPSTEKIVYVTSNMMPATYGNVMIRSAKSEKDYTGGINQYTSSKEGLVELANRITK